ncbi:MAG TPA: cytochrome c [Verrucomicrobiae bacterium]|jgi:mono/diheme cytochrome c family protein|nr:cytochrome c [Verrucomicrobiae bacterium]
MNQNYYLLRGAKFLLSLGIVTAGMICAAFADVLPVPPMGTPGNQGYKLFMLNCAHCHGTDARGDEGPDLHGVLKSDQRLTNIIQNGIKGEMPKFGAKLSAADTQALIAFIRTLKE